MDSLENVKKIPNGLLGRSKMGPPGNVNMSKRHSEGIQNGRTSDASNMFKKCQYVYVCFGERLNDLFT